MPTTSISKPLKGIKILELSRVLAGPYCAQVLADFGADVTKIEQQGVGDETRNWGPPDWGPKCYSAYYSCANRGKKSVTMDFKNSEQLSFLKSKLAEYEIVIENFRAGTLEKFGLDYESYKKVRPDGIYCTISGFGSKGSRQNKPGYDFLIQGMTGLMSITGSPDGAPTKVGVAVIDLFTGLHAAHPIQAALFSRERSGFGAHIEISLYDAAINLLANQATNYLCSGNSPGKIGNNHPNIVPYQTLYALDGEFLVAVGNEATFARFANALGCPEWTEDPRFSTNSKRVSNRIVFNEIVKKITVTKSIDDWITLLEEADIPCGPLQTVGEALSSAFSGERELLIHQKNQDGTNITTVSNPTIYNGSRLNADKPPPKLGEHNPEFYSVPK